MFTMQQENATKFGTKMKFYTFFYIIKWLLMVLLQYIHAYFYLIRIVSCSWSNPIKELLQSVAEKSATTFGDLPDR